MVLLTQRDDAILELLASRVRVLTLSQIACAFWGRNRFPRRDALRRLKQLPVMLKTSVTHPVLDLSTPVYRWFPQQPEPRFEELAYRIKKRWCQPPQKETFVSLANSRPVRATERLHDACVAEIYLRHHRNSPDWIHEDHLVDWVQEKRPDAILRRVEGQDVVIEFVGSYCGRKLRDIHRVYAAHDTPYEFW